MNRLKEIKIESKRIAFCDAIVRLQNALSIKWTNLSCTKAAINKMNQQNHKKTALKRGYYI